MKKKKWKRVCNKNTYFEKKKEEKRWNGSQMISICIFITIETKNRFIIYFAFVTASAWKGLSIEIDFTASSSSIIFLFPLITHFFSLSNEWTNLRNELCLCWIILFLAGDYSHVYDAERAWHEHQQRMKEIERR